MDPAQLPLRDLHLPASVDWWPLALGWWVLIALVAVLAVWQSSRAFAQWRRNAPRRYALRQLADFESAYREHGDPVTLARQVSGLLRRSMLAYAPRGDVAGLTGKAWLEWLDRDLPVPYFHTDGGKSLLSLPYRRPDSDYGNVDVGAMLSAVRMRLTTPMRGTR